jgi:hypothetical protein
MKRFLVAAIALGALFAPVLSHAACIGYFPLDPDVLYSNPVIIDPHESHISVSLTRPFWTVLAAQPWYQGDNSDYDVSIYQNASGAAQPFCFSGLLAVSARTGSTDFVIGDFNHNPYGEYFGRVNCFSGPCNAASVQYRDGGTVLTVNSAGLIQTSVPATPGRSLIRVYDVYLFAGTHYYFNFASSGDLQQKMLLFRNPANGVYWAGRNDAVFEVSGCTTYDAPASGYYGFLTGTFTISVTTQPVCSCPTLLASGVPVATAAGPAIDHRLTVQTDPYWSAVGLRSTSDWDLVASTLGREHPSVDCADVQLGSSMQAFDQVEVVVSDGNHIAVPDSMHITSATFVGNQPATIEMDAGKDDVNRVGWKFGGSFGSANVVKAWDLPLVYEDAFGIKLQTFGTSARAMVFRNPGNGSYVAGRTEAVVSTTDTATYVAPQPDTYGLVLLHEDGNPGGVLLEGGICAMSPPLADGSLSLFRRNMFTSIVPTVATWGVVSTIGETDCDIQLYGSQQGTGYPDCYSDPTAASNAAGLQAEFLVGDFRSAPLTPVYARLYDFSMTSPNSSWAEWNQATVPVIVNGASVADNMVYHLAVPHEVHLVAGATCQIHLVTAPSGQQVALLFGNSGSGAYWAPRSTALTQTSSTVSFTPPYTGAYALVVVDDGLGNTGTTYVSVTDGVTGVPAANAPRVTQLAGAGPNPSHGALDLRYELAEPLELGFELVDVTGRTLSHLGLGRREAGAGQARWVLTGVNGGRFAPGVYFVRMTAGGKSVGTRRVTLMR